MPPAAEFAVDSTGKKLNQFEVQECLNELRMLVKANPQYKVRTDDIYLMRYLQCTGFRIGDALKWIQEINDFKIQNKGFYATSNPSNYSLIMSLKAKLILKDRDKFGRRIYLTRLANIDTNLTDVTELIQFDDLWLEAILDEPETQANGISFVIDLAGFSWKMFKWLTPRNVRIGSKKTELLALKNITYHVINSSMLLNAAVALIFPFLSSKTKEHIIFHYQDWDSLHKFIDPHSLPEEYGGTKKSIEFEEMNKWLIEQSPRLMENFKNDYRIS